MNCLVSVRFRKRDVILYLSRNRPPVGVNDAKSAVAIGKCRKDNTEREYVVYFRDVPIPSFQFPKKTIHAFDARFGAECSQACFGKLALHILLDFLKPALVLIFTLLSEFTRFFIFLFACMRECGI